MPIKKSAQVVYKGTKRQDQNKESEMQNTKNDNPSSYIALNQSTKSIIDIVAPFKPTLTTLKLNIRRSILVLDHLLHILKGLIISLLNSLKNT